MPQFGMVQGVEGLQPELQNVVIVEGHAELLVHLGIEVDDARTLDGIPPDIAEESGRRLGKGRGVQPAGRRPVAHEALTPGTATGRS